MQVASGTTQHKPSNTADTNVSTEIFVMTPAHFLFRLGTAAASATLLCASFIAVNVSAQDINAGKIVYTTPAVVGQKSCSDASCHTLNPLNNQNRILKAADDTGAIGVAINTVLQMAFLKGPTPTSPPRLTSTQLIDLAAYIGNPSAATGSPIAQLTPTSLTFAATVIGNNAATQIFAINNTGSTALLVSGVSSSAPDFSVVSSCDSIAAGAHCNVSVGFTPSAAGTRSGTITVSHNASGGSSTVSALGSATAPVPLTPGIQIAPASVAFGLITVGSFSGAQFVTVMSVGNAPLTLNAIAIASGSDFPIASGSGSCAVGVPLAAGNSCTVQLRFQPTVEGVQVRTLSIGHNASASAVTVGLSGTGGASSAPNLRTMVEYVYLPLNYFFITSRDDDTVTLDAIAGFQRTGLSFSVYATQTGSAKAISRFYFDKVAVNGSRGSHFYTLLDSDKAALTALNPGNAQTPRLPYNEGIDSWAFLPVVAGVGGSCASGQRPIYRMFRGGARFPDDPNHRFTSDVATYNAFVAQGWDGEGVNFCVPLP